jgi:hypothetical protein
VIRCRAQAEIVFPLVGDAVFAPLHAAGIETLAIKGATLFDRYPAPGLRPMDDIDLLAPGPLFERSLAVLRDAGWRPVRRANARQHETVLVHDGVPGLAVEVHRVLQVWARRSSRLSAQELWHRRVATTIAGAPAWKLDAEDEIVLAATHMAKPFHVIRRMIWVLDLAVIIDAAARANRPIDWNLVQAKATAARARTAMATALTLAKNLGVDSPEALRTLPRSQARRAALGPALSEEWPLDIPSRRTMHRLGYALVDDWRLRVMLFIEAVTKPDWRGAVPRGARAAVQAARSWHELRHLHGKERLQ